MSLSAVPHLNFRNQAREALDFYKSVFGGQVMAFSYSDMKLLDDPADADNIAWGQVATDNGLTLMAYDVQTAREFQRGDRSFYIALAGETESEIQESWDGLSDGAEILTPLGPSPFSPLYGMLTDRYGVTWIISIRG